MTGFSNDTITRMFEHEPGVLVLDTRLTVTPA
jgi:hypothetical protein